MSHLIQFLEWVSMIPSKKRSFSVENGVILVNQADEWPTALNKLIENKVDCIKRRLKPVNT